MPNQLVAKFRLDEFRQIGQWHFDSSHVGLRIAHSQLTEAAFAEKALGRVDYVGGPKQAESRAFRRSLFVAQDIRKGERFTPENVRCVRPAAGMHPRYLGRVLGKRAAKDIEAGTPLRAGLVQRLRQ